MSDGGERQRNQEKRPRRRHPNRVSRPRAQPESPNDGCYPLGRNPRKGEGSLIEQGAPALVLPLLLREFFRRLRTFTAGCWVYAMHLGPYSKLPRENTHERKHLGPHVGSKIL